MIKTLIKFTTAVVIFLFLFILDINKANAGYYIVVAESGSDVIVSNGSSFYKINYSYDCYSSDFSVGESIYIDSYIFPSYGDAIVVEGTFDTNACEVISSDELDLKEYDVVKVLDSSDNIIVEDKYGDQYLVEYGIGCLSMWRYEGRKIYIDASILDGISDTIYLFDSDDTCKVWDAEELNSSAGYSSPSTYTAPIPQPTTCPQNSYLSGSQCLCVDGYAVNSDKNACIPITQYCQSIHGVNSYGSGKSCYCSAGYQLNSSGNSCIKIETPVQATTSNLPTISVTEPQKAEVKTEPPKIDESKIKPLDKEIRATLKVAGAFRDCPSTLCGVIRYYAETADVQVVGNYNNEEWFKIRAKDDNGKWLDGWMHNSVLEIVAEPTQIIETQSTTTETINNKRDSWIRKLWQFILRIGY